MAFESVNYGISKMVIGDDNVDSTIVKFGDGRTRISTVGWGPEYNNSEINFSGIQLCRDGREDKPFATFVGMDADHVNNLPNHDKIYLVFDNTRSIDVAIERLIEAKEMLISSQNLHTV